MELVERLQLVVHVGVLIPGRGDQHGERVRGRSAGRDEQLEGGIERRRVRPALVDQREQLAQVVAEQRRAQERLARVHPLPVAADRVDLAVVGEVLERLREVPAAERVRREARVHERHRALELGLAQVGEVARQLRRREQALVDERRVRERGDAEGRLGDAPRGRGELDAAADHEQLAAERTVILRAPAADQQLADDGLAVACDAPDRRRVAGDVAPAERLLALLDRDAHAQLFAAHAQVGILWQKAHRDAVVAERRQLEIKLGARPSAQEAIGDLQQQAGAIAGVGVGPARTPVLHRAEHRDRVLDQLVAARAVLPREQAEPASVVLGAWVVKRVGTRLHRSDRTSIRPV